MLQTFLLNAVLLPPSIFNPVKALLLLFSLQKWEMRKEEEGRKKKKKKEGEEERKAAVFAARKEMGGFVKRKQ